MNSQSLRLAMVAILALVVSACGGETAGTTTTISSSATTIAATTTAPEATPADSTTTTEFTGEVTITPPEEIRTASDFTVTWTGPNQEVDYVTIVPLGADEGAYTTFFYTESAEDGTLLAPAEAGEYEIRYVDGLSQSTLYSITVTVLP